MKLYYEMENVGSSRYTVSFHDGMKTHGDGSAFFDIRLFSNKRKKNRFVRSLVAAGYTYRRPFATVTGG